MSNERRPDDMTRINTPELAQAFINEQIAIVKEQVIEVFKNQMNANLVYVDAEMPLKDNVYVVIIGEDEKLNTLLK